MKKAISLENLSKKDLFFLAKITKSEEEREGAVKSLLQRNLMPEELHEIFLLNPASWSKICEKLAEAIGHGLASFKMRAWSQQRPDRLAQMLL